MVLNDGNNTTARRILAQAVQRLRIQAGLKVEDLARSANMPVQHLEGIEQASRLVTIDEISRLADALGVPPAELFKDELN